MPPPSPPPRRPAAAELSPPLCSAPPPLPLPPRPALPPEPPPSRRPAPLGPQPATGAGGGGDAGRRLLLPAISSLLPGSPRWLSAEGSGLEGRHVGGGFHHRKCLGARRGEAGRGGRGVARRLEAWPAARSRSLAHSPRLLSPTAALGLRGCRGRLGAKLASLPRGGSHGAGAAAGPARGLLRVHCVRLSVSPRGAEPGERGAWAEPRTGGSSGRRGTCATRAASPPRGRGSPPHPLLPSLDLSSAPL